MEEKSGPSSAASAVHPPPATHGRGPGAAARVAEKSSPSPELGVKSTAPPRHPRAKPGGDGSESGGEEQQSERPAAGRPAAFSAHNKTLQLKRYKQILINCNRN